MKVLFNKNILLNGLNIVSKAISGRTTNPILNCILLDASTSTIKLVGNDDMELGIETIIEGEIIRNGKVALDSKLMIEIIRKIESENHLISIDVNPQFYTTIQCNKSVFAIQGFDGEEYTYLPYIEKNNFIKLSQLTLKEAIRQTLFSAAVNDPNRILCGEFIKVHENIVDFTALDGHRIALRHIYLKENYPDAKVILPSKSLGEIARIVSGDNEQEVTIYFSENHVLFELDHTIVICRTVDGEYFKLENMLSSDYITKVYVHRQKLLNAIDSSTIFLRESDHKPIIFDIIDGFIHLSAKSVFGEMNAELECIKTGKDLKIAFNPKFLLDALKVIDDEYINMYLNHSKSPLFIRDAEQYVYVILPVNFVE